MSETANTEQLLNEDAISFIAIWGMLSALAYPLSQLVWLGSPIHIGKYILLLALFGAAFLRLMLAAHKFPSFRRAFPLYINWGMPSLCLAAWLAPNFYNKFSTSLLYTALVNRSAPLRNPYHISPSNKSVEALVEFIHLYADDQGRIAIFVDSDDQVEALLLAGKTDLLGMSEADMSAFSPTYSATLLGNARAAAGKPTCIFYCAREKCLIPLQQQAYNVLTGQGAYAPIDKKHDIIVLKKVEK